MRNHKEYKPYLFKNVVCYVVVAKDQHRIFICQEIKDKALFWSEFKTKSLPCYSQHKAKEIADASESDTQDWILLNGYTWAELLKMKRSPLEHMKISLLPNKMG